MKIQIKNSHKVIGGITFLAALMSITAFKAIGHIQQTQNALGCQTKVNSLYIDILTMSDKVEALSKFITGSQEVKE
jgi:hypothetical protein